MKNRQPWLRDRQLIGVPVGWRKVAWAARYLAAEHDLKTFPSVAWPTPDSLGTPVLSLSGAMNPSPTLSPQRQENQVRGLFRAQICAASASRFCMACGKADAPAHVRLISGGTVAVMTLLCAECEYVAQLEGFAFWPTLGRFDPLSHAEDEEFTKGWDPAMEDDPDDDDPWDTRPDT